MSRVLFDKVRNGLDTFLKANCCFDVWVLNQPSGNHFPNIVLTEIDNSMRGRTGQNLETISSIVYELNIYAQEERIDNTTIDNLSVAYEIADSVQMYFEKVLFLERAMKRPTPNIDERIYRITMRYEGILNDNRQSFY